MAKRGMEREGRRKGGWRREREMEKAEGEHGELRRKKTKRVNAAQTLVRRGEERRKQGSQKPVLSLSRWERSKKSSLSRPRRYYQLVIKKMCFWPIARWVF